MYCGSGMAYLINYKGFCNRYNNYKIVTHTDFERGVLNSLNLLKVYKSK